MIKPGSLLKNADRYLSADAGSVSEGSFSAFFSFSSCKQTKKV